MMRRKGQYGRRRREEGEGERKVKWGERNLEVYKSTKSYRHGFYQLIDSWLAFSH